jgi:ABC-type multidrug transport system permease subunit
VFQTPTTGSRKTLYAITMNPTGKNALLTLGVIFQLIGLFCFFTFWLMYFGAAFFIIGAVTIFLSRKSWYKQIAANLPMLFAIGLIINALTFEKYIVPENFRGVVYVITNEHGQDREYDFFTRVFRIPPSGILFTKFHQKEGFNNKRFYSLGKKGSLKQRMYKKGNQEIGYLFLF